MGVDDKEGAANILRETEIGRPSAAFFRRVQPVVKDAAYAACLVAVRQEEILVAPGLHSGIVGDVRILVAGKLHRLVECPGVRVVLVAPPVEHRSKVRAAAKPL